MMIEKRNIDFCFWRKETFILLKLNSHIGLKYKKNRWWNILHPHNTTRRIGSHFSQTMCNFVAIFLCMRVQQFRVKTSKKTSILQQTLMRSQTWIIMLQRLHHYLRITLHNNIANTHFCPEFQSSYCCHCFNFFHLVSLWYLGKCINYHPTIITDDNSNPRFIILAKNGSIIIYFERIQWRWFPSDPSLPCRRYTCWGNGQKFHNVILGNL